MNKRGSREGHLKKGNYAEQVRKQDFMSGVVTGPKWTKLPKCIFIV